MAFIMTLNLFLAASALTDYETLPILDEYKTNSTSTQFVECVANTKFGSDLQKEGDLEGATCALLADESERVCQRFPKVSSCCPNRCREKFVCAADYLTREEDKTDSPYTATTQCLAATWYPSLIIFKPWWWFGASWQKEKYNTCDKIYDEGYTAIGYWGYSELEICCPKQNLAVAKKLRNDYLCPGTPVIPSTSAPPGIDCSNDRGCKEGEKCIENHCTVPETPIIIVNCTTDKECKPNTHEKKCKNKVCSAASTVYGLTAALVLMLFAF